MNRYGHRMSSHPLLRGLTLNFTNDSFNVSEQNESFISAYHATSAIPELSETADQNGSIGWLEYIPPGIEVLLPIGMIVLYIWYYIGSPCYIWRECRQKRFIQIA